MKLFLTGATGFVGFNFLLQALSDTTIERIGVSVRHGGKLVSLLASEGIYGIPAKLQIIQGNAKNWKTEELDFSPSVCLHCAGVLFARTKKEYFDGNVEGTRKLLQSLPADCPCIILSSQSAVGSTPSGSQARIEEDTPAPLSFYGASKLAMEEMIASEFSSKRKILILRPSIVLGPRDSASLPLFQMTKYPLWCKPCEVEKILSWIAVDDLVKGIFAILRTSQHQSGTYFICAQDPISDEELIRTAGGYFGHQAPILQIPKFLLRIVAKISAWVPAIGHAVPSLMPDRFAELFEDSWLISSKKFQQDFAWKSQANLATTLHATAECYKKRGIL